MIHDLILEKLRGELQKALIDDLAADDPTRAGVVKIGPLQGDPDPDIARISVTLHENDPESDIDADPNRQERWQDDVEETEVGGGITWSRKFTINARCLLEQTREDLTEARKIASTVRSRIERTLLKIRFSGLTDGSEYVSRGVFGENLYGVISQFGGPPDAYDFQIKVRFDVLTSERIGV
jgi:hypothetical protein